MLGRTRFARGLIAGGTGTSPPHPSFTPLAGSEVAAPDSALPEFSIFPGGGGVSSGAGASDAKHKPTKPSTPTAEVHIINQPVDHVLDFFNQSTPTVDTWNPSHRSKQKEFYDRVKKQREDAKARRKLRSTRTVSTGAGGVQDIAFSPSGKSQSVNDSENAHTHEEGKNSSWRDGYYDSFGRWHWSRSPHSYSNVKHERDICAAVALRSHNGGKGASRSKVVSMIRAWYFCQNKK